MRSLKFSHITLLISIVITLACFKRVRWEGNDGANKEQVICSDGLGYYSYLPAIFIDHNLGEMSADLAYTNETSNGVVIKYMYGTALLEAPFFAIAHTYALSTDHKADGYSAPYQLMIGLSGIFYLFLGLFFLAKFLKLFDISDSNIAITIALILFGTNLFYYGAFLGSMAHVYSFSAISCFAYISKKWGDSKESKFIMFAGILLALIVLIRPTNAIVAALPFLFASTKYEAKNLFQRLTKDWRGLSYAALVFWGLICIQMIIWNIQTGQFIVWSYPNEGFNFLDPQFFKSLFSFRKGLFIYTPLTLIALFGLVHVVKQSKYRFVVLLGFFIVITFIISSWWSWYYGDGFGLRAFIDYYVFFALLLAILLQNIAKNIKRFVLFPLLGFCLMLNLVQSYQYYKRILHPFSMNAKMYAYVFLKTSNEYVGVLGGNKDIQPYSKHGRQLILSTENNYDAVLDGWTNGIVSNNAKCQNEVSSNNYCSYNSNEYGTAFSIQNNQDFINADQLYAEASFKVLDLVDNGSSDALFLVEKRNADEQIEYYYRFKINEIPVSDKCEWRECEYSFLIPKMEFGDVLTIMVWNIENQQFILDDFKIDFYKIL